MGGAAPAAGAPLVGANSSGGSLKALDGRVRILATAAFALATVSFSHFGPLLIALGGAMLVARLVELPILKTLRRIIAMDMFIAFMILMLPFTTLGEPLFFVFGFPASRQGLVEAALIGLKANAIVLMAMALLSSFEPVELARAMGRLGVPERLVHLVLFNIRYIDLLYRELHRLRTAMRARAFRANASWHACVSMGYLIGMMLIRALERSERILQAMKCRGFTGRLYLDGEERIQRLDLVFAAAFAAFVGALTLWEILSVAAL
ncbi:cobalt/nickel transport system permease protein [Roseiarcus fermentans]|uniref:Cobalt/nickel transport system permease protein n=1 Tax=Roseiarcus fermentans TaxID=1473586 RepID=A0A366FGD6_9HYPH|nr:cobalt ECF transporter T component CbiQ [Roseiarcus fermentans]RBP13176.1 cobalt/nickel transport system permease protein [Roseiarcus fermentans]